jgi:hypothetical protein
MSNEKKSRFGSILILAGVLAWLPYLIYHIFIDSVTPVPFLAVHLAGVIGGSVLRRSASSDQAPLPHSLQWIKTLSTILLVIGVLVWVVYFGLNAAATLELPVGLFVVLHLVFILSGAAMKIFLVLKRR